MSLVYGLREIAGAEGRDKFGKYNTRATYSAIQYRCPPKRERDTGKSENTQEAFNTAICTGYLVLHDCSFDQRQDSGLAIPGHDENGAGRG